MALTSYPFENANTTEDQYTLLFRNFADSGIVGSYDDTQFNVTTDGSGLDVQVSAGYAILRGHAVNNDGPVTVTLDTADPTNPRIDRIVLRLDPVLDGITLVVIKGTPAVAPVAPAIVQTNVGVWDLPVARVRVGAAALNVNAADITSERSWGGHKFGVWRTADRPVDPFIGKPGFNIDISGAEVWTGTKWESVVTKRKVVIPHTFTLVGPVVAANAAGDYFIPPFFVPQVPGQAARLVGVKTLLNHGLDTAAVDFRITSHSVATPVVVKTHLQAKAGRLALSHAALSDLTDQDRVYLEVTGVTADPKNLTVTLFVEYEA